MDTPLKTTQIPKASRREWIGLAVIALPCLLYSMDLTVLNLAVPALSRDLQPSSAQLLWIVDIYGFMIAGFLITMGTLGDRIGRRRLLLIGAATFGAASVLAAFSHSAAMLITTRAILGIAGATLAPSTLSLIRNMFLDASQRTVAIGVWVMSFSVGAAIGPLLGGVMLQYFWWGSVFLIGVPVMLLLLIVGPVLLPEYRNPNAGRLDLVSVVLSLAAVLTAIYGLKRIAESGPTLTRVAFILIGIVIGVVFVRRQGKLADPQIDLQLFRTPAFSAAIAAYALSIFVTFGVFFYFAQYLQLVLGLSPLQAGLCTLPSSGGFIVGSMIAPALLRWMRPAYAMAASMALATLGFCLLTSIDGPDGLGVLIAGSLLLSLGISPVVTLAVDLVVGAAPPERAGMASGISEASSEFGGALGIAVLGSIGTAIYRSRIATAVANGTLPDTATEASATLGGAIATATQLPEPWSTTLLETARAAFVQAFGWAASIGVAVLIALASVTVMLLRRVEPRKQTP